MIRLQCGNALHVAYLRPAAGTETVGKNASNKNTHDSVTRLQYKKMHWHPYSNEHFNTDAHLSADSLGKQQIAFFYIHRF